MPDYGLDPFTVARIVDAAEGRVRYEPQRRKVGIIGAGPLRSTAPWDDPEWILWGLNEIPQKRATAWFELHPMRAQSQADLAWLQKCPVPCYVLDYYTARNFSEIEYYGEVFPGIPRPVEYPLDRVLSATSGRRYFTCTFAYQVALALADGFEEIGLWGVDLDLGTPRERLVEKPCLEYWLGLAEGRGVRVTMPEGTTLLNRPYLYGYDYHAERLEVDGAVAGLRAAMPDAIPRNWHRSIYWTSSNRGS